MCKKRKPPSCNSRDKVNQSRKNLKVRKKHWTDNAALSAAGMQSILLVAIQSTLLIKF